MRILYVSQYFPPEMCAPSARVHELSREWVALGHEVTVLTAFAHHPTGVKAPRDRGVLTRREKIDGIDVVRTYVFAAANKGVVKRMLSYASFLLSAVVIGPGRVRRPDVVIATSPQLLCGLAGFVLARLLRVPFVFEVRDLWPESILAVEALREGLLIRSLKELAQFLYRHCDRIVTVGDGYRRGLLGRYDIPSDRVSVIRNGIDTGLFTPLPRAGAIREEFGWGDRFVLLYAGTHGMAHGLADVLAAARELRNDVDKRFVFVGDGAEKEDLVRMAKEQRLDNVQFIGHQPRARMPQFYAACDLGLVTLRDTPLFQEVLPSKMFEYLGMQRPVLLTVNGEARQVVEDARAGEYVPPGDVTALTAAIRRLAVQRDRLAQMGEAGREYVLKHFDRRALAREYLVLLQGVTGQVP